jgi:hypothetical protein
MSSELTDRSTHGQCSSNTTRLGKWQSSRKLSLRRLAFCVLAAVLVCGAPAAAKPVGHARAVAADDLRPDIAMAKLDSLHIDVRTIKGRHLLRFRTKVVNVGDGPLELVGTRSSAKAPTMWVKQRIYNSAGTFRDIFLPHAKMQFNVGDGHHHWHVLNLMLGILRAADGTGRPLRTAKIGFCMNDNGVYSLRAANNAPAKPVYKDCKAHNRGLEVHSGLSVGYSDTYGANIAFQWIDVTNVPDGNYRLQETYDPAHWLSEKVDEHGEPSRVNNTTWVDIALAGTQVHVVDSGPALG